jgi:hypothetical protein
MPAMQGCLNEGEAPLPKRIAPSESASLEKRTDSLNFTKWDKLEVSDDEDEQAEEADVVEVDRVEEEASARVQTARDADDADDLVAVLTDTALAKYDGVRSAALIGVARLAVKEGKTGFDGATQLCAAGACAAVVAACAACDASCRWALSAISTLAISGDEGARLLGEAGACDAVILAMKARPCCRGRDDRYFSLFTARVASARRPHIAFTDGPAGVYNQPR